jgi:hypothetical protein
LEEAQNGIDLTALEALLKEEEDAGRAHGIADLEVHQTRRAKIAEILVPLKKTVDLLAARYRILQQLPNVDDVTWATRMLAYRLAIIVIDTTSVNRDADIIRVTVSDRKGSALFDRVIRPLRQEGQANSTYTGIERELVLAAPSLAEVWSDPQVVLENRYVLAYGFDFLQTRLNENAQHYGLQRLKLAGGECLMLRAKHYYSIDANPKLADVCRRIGHEMPPVATTLDRLYAQLLLLRAMSEATIDVHQKARRIVEAESVPGEEEAPFDENEYDLP